MLVFFSSADGTRKTCSSSYYSDAGKVADIVIAQNAKAEEMGIKARYTVADCDKSELPADAKVKMS